MFPNISSFAHRQNRQTLRMNVGRQYEGVGGVENMLMHYVPEVKQIEEVAPHEEDEDDDIPTMEFKPNVV